MTEYVQGSLLKWGTCSLRLHLSSAAVGYIGGPVGSS